MNDLVFVDTPPPTSQPDRRRSKWHDILDQLRARPGEWALVQEGHARRDTPYNIMRGTLGRSYRGEFEATGRKQPDGTYDTYARYVGNANGAAS